MPSGVRYSSVPVALIWVAVVSGKRVCSLVHETVAPLYLDQANRRLAVGHHEVDVAAVDVPEVPQVEIASADVLLVVHPLQQVHGHQVLEGAARSRTWIQS